ncbi:other FunK1 protein kinase [Rhizoctonia solani]|uniref:Other FunK1 protein kinase n=1 Tax=Rhizoctonia solani TaxID=456999 RepID=A0A8H7LX98_9AGAM|nr:other FunK1 protein kinase [Rhizoctonia solani]
MALNSLDSPIKESRPLWQNRTASDARKDAVELGFFSKISGAGFINAYLSTYSTEPSPGWSSDQLNLVQRIKNWSDNEDCLYTSDAPLLRLLNSISEQVHAGRNQPNALSLFFRSYHKQIIKTQYPGPGQKPDLLALWRTPVYFEQHRVSLKGLWHSSGLLTRLPEPDSREAKSDSPYWYSVVTVGEVKLDRRNLSQIGDYARCLLRHHPELNAVMGLSVRRKGYQLVYHDASVIHQSDEFPWLEGFGPLHAFIQALYDQPFRDASMVMLGPNNGSADARRRFFEGKLYEKAHSGKNLAGLMTIKAYGYVLDGLGKRIGTSEHCPEAGQSLPTPRYKMRLLTGDVGRPLEQAQTLSELLCVMYDACAVQRNLYRKCRLLHRDISNTNIMLAPLSEEYQARCAVGYAEVKFANQIFSDNPEEKPEPTCLIIDLGNGADLEDRDHPESLTERTGTPKFIARSISRGRHLDFDLYGRLQVQMPSLAGKPLELYHRATGGHVDFRHQLFHDAESTFWVLAWTLAQSQKRGSPQETQWTPGFRKFTQAMKNHYPGTAVPDPRSDLDSGVGDWRDILHTDLACLATMLSQMHRYIRPEWAFRDLNSERISEAPEHMHEAIMRLLLTEIVRSKQPGNDISLVVGGRSLPIPKSSSQTSRSGTLSLGVPSSRSRTSTSTDNGTHPDVMPDRVGMKRSGSPLGGSVVAPVNSARGTNRWPSNGLGPERDKKDSVGGYWESWSC